MAGHTFVLRAGEQWGRRLADNGKEEQKCRRQGGRESEQVAVVPEASTGTCTCDVGTGRGRGHPKKVRIRCVCVSLKRERVPKVVQASYVASPRQWTAKRGERKRSRQAASNWHFTL